MKKSIIVGLVPELLAEVDALVAASYGVDTRNSWITGAIVEKLMRTKNLKPVAARVASDIPKPPARPRGRPPKPDKTALGRAFVEKMGGQIVQDGRAGRVFKFSHIKRTDGTPYVRYEGYATLPLEEYADELEKGYFFPSKAVVDEALRAGVELEDSFGPIAPNEYKPPEA